MECKECGAAIRRDDGRFCSHCGAALPDRPRISPEEWNTHPARFDEAEAGPGFGAAMSREAPPPPRGAVLAPLLFGVVWVGMGGFITSQFAKDAGAMFLFPLVMVIFGVGLVGTIVVKGVRFARAPVERKVVVVVDKRTQMSGGGERSSVTTTYYVTVQTKAGERTELQATADIAGMVTSGDIGVAQLRLSTLVGFARLPA